MNKKESLSHRDFIRMLLISGLAILLSMTCLVSASWAWFSESLSTSPDTLTAASYELAVEIDDVARAEKSVELAEGRYEISLTPGGTATRGYCVVTVALEGVGEASSSTVTIPQSGGAFTFTLVLEAPASVTFRASWGIPAASGIARGGRLTVSAGGVHTVE